MSDGPKVSEARYAIATLPNGQVAVKIPDSMDEDEFWSMVEWAGAETTGTVQMTTVSELKKLAKQNGWQQ